MGGERQLSPTRPHAAGFPALFEAHWLWRAPEPPAAQPQPVLDGVRWRRVETDQDLEYWESAWGSLPGQARIFLPALLQNPDIVFLAGGREQEIQAGCIAYLSSGVIGVSNLFSPEEDEAGWWAVALDAAQSFFPGLPLVDYEQGDSLALARSLGFEEIGPLVIWAQ
jgi:hypothetical protein